MRLSLISAIFIATISTLDAQVGINTTDPKRILDINGNLKIVKTDNKTTQIPYRNILVADENNGNVDYISFPSINQNETKNVEIIRSIYLGTTPDNSKVCSCGEITFYLNSNKKAYFKLNSTKVFTTNNNANSITLAFGAKRWEGQGYTYRDITEKTFLTTNYSDYQSMDATDFTADNTISVYTIVLPKQSNLYRLTVSTLKNSNSTTNTNIYSLICEKFYTQSL